MDAPREQSWPADEHVTQPPFWRLYPLEARGHGWVGYAAALPLGVLIALLTGHPMERAYPWPQALAAISSCAFVLGVRHLRRRTLRVRKIFREGRLVRSEVVAPGRGLSRFHVRVTFVLGEMTHTAVAELGSNRLRYQVLKHGGCWLVVDPQNPANVFVPETYGARISLPLATLTPDGTPWF